MKVFTATRGQNALDLLDNERFDIIVLDLAMPGMDGLKTLQHIKKKDADAEIVMLSGHGDVKSTTEAELLEKIAEAREKRILILEKHAQKKIEEILQSKPW